MHTRGADAAIAQVVQERGELLVRYAYLLTGDLHAAQDLLQDALVKVLSRTRVGFEPDVLEAYVRRTIMTLYIDGYRRRRRRRGAVHLGPVDDVAPAPAVGPAESLDLRAALATLGRQERAAVVLRYFDDLTVPDVARAMGLAEGTVKRYLSNATRRLQERLGPVAEPPDGDVTVVATPRAGRRD